MIDKKILQGYRNDLHSNKKQVGVEVTRNNQMTAIL